MTGSIGPTSKFPCLWCETPSSLLDRTYDELKIIAQNRPEKRISLAQLNFRPAIKDLRSLPDLPNNQRSNTFNILCLERGGGTILEPTNIAPPTLHIHIGIVSKILKASDGIVDAWKSVTAGIEEGKNSSTEILAHALARCGARREDYYSGQLSGVPCTNLMSRMPVFCVLFFHRRTQALGTVTEAVPSMIGLESKLKELRGIYCGSTFSDGKGIEYLLRTQER